MQWTARQRPFFPPKTRSAAWLLLILLFGWALRIVWLTHPGYQPDVDFFIPWMRLAAQHGIIQLFVQSTSSYPPLSVYLLAGLGLLSSPASMETAVLPAELTFLRTTISLFELTLVAVIYALGRRAASPRVGLLAAALYAFTPGAIFLAGWWVQIDAWFILPMVTAVGLLARGRVGWAWACLGIAMGFKVQAVVILPIFVVGTWRWYGFKRLFGGVGALATSLLLPLLPIARAGLLTAFFQKTTETLRELPWITAQAHNLWYAVEPNARFRGFDINSDLNAAFWGISYRDVGLMLLAIGFVLVLARLVIRSGPRSVYMASVLGWLLFFMLPTRIHGRYLFYALALLLCAGFYQRRWWALYGVTAVTLFFNLFFHTLPYAPWSAAVNIPAGLAVVNAWINLGLLLVALVWYWQPLFGSATAHARQEGTLAQMQAGWEKAALGLAGIGLLLLVVGLTVQGRRAGQAVAEWAAPLTPSLQTQLPPAGAQTVVVNWPRMVQSGETAVYGIVPLTPPAYFLPLPTELAPEATFVQYPPWQPEVERPLTYHGQFVTEAELRQQLDTAHAILLFESSGPQMISLMARQPVLAAPACSATFAETVCLGAATAGASGERVQIELQWQLLSPSISPNLTAFVHLLGADGRLLNQADGDLVGGLLPFAALSDTASLSETRLADLPAEVTTIHVGMYDRLSSERLPVRCAQTAVCTPDAIIIPVVRP